MKRDVIYKLFVIFCLIMWNVACSEYEMIKFSEPPAVNFSGLKSDNYPDAPESQSAIINFGTKYQFGVLYDTLTIGVKLEGALSDKPLRVTLNSVAIEDTPLVAEFVFPDESYILADTNKTSVRVLVKRPWLYDTLYQANLVFDYANSDVQAGSRERQMFKVSVRDELTFKMLGIDEATWLRYYQLRVGVFGEVKIRFMLSVLKTMNFKNGFTDAKFQQIRDALTAYNIAHPDDHLKEANGDLVNCDPA